MTPVMLFVTTLLNRYKQKHQKHAVQKKITNRVSW